MAEFSRFLLVVSLAVIGVTACSDDSAEIAEVSFASSSDDNRYTSELFGVSVVKPDGWYASEVELADQLMETGRDFIAGDDDNLRALLDASTQNTFNIFGFYNYEVGAPVEVNPNILAVAERVKLMPGIKTGADYLFHSKTFLQGTAMEISFSEEKLQKDVDGHLFDGMQMTSTVPVVGEVQQRMYAARNGDFAIAFVLTYRSAEQLDALEGILDTVRLDWEK